MTAPYVSYATNVTTVGPNLASAGTFAAGGALTVTSNAAAALAVGANGATNPVLAVDASAANAATGVKVTGAAAAGGVALAAVSSGANEAMTVNAKGTGALQLQSAATGALLIGNGAGFISVPTAAAPAASNAPTDSALVVTGAVAPFPVRQKALVSGMGAVDTNTGVTVTQNAADVLNATSLNFNFSQVAGIVRVTFSLGVTLANVANPIIVTFALASLTTGTGSAAVPLPTGAGSTFVAATAARGYCHVADGAAVRRVVTVAAGAGTSNVVLTLTPSGATTAGAATLDGAFWYNVNG